MDRVGDESDERADQHGGSPGRHWAVLPGNPCRRDGQLPVDPATGKIPEGIAAQTEQALKNLSAILAEQGMGLENVVKTTVFLADMGDFAGMNEVYAKHFKAPYPSRSAFQVAKLPLGAPLEIECIAVK